MKILLIGNSGYSHNVSDGQTEKTRIYYKKIKYEGHDIIFVDLEDFFKHFASILFRIKKAIRECDRVVLLAAQRGCRVLIPYINWCNKKYHKSFVLPLIGTSVLHYFIDKLTPEDKNDFLINGNYSLVKKNKKITKDLSKVSYILPETDLLTKVFKDFFNIQNVYTLNNFRESSPIAIKNNTLDKELRVVYLSRVMSEKGIFDLLESVNDLNKTNVVVHLDIFGKKELNKNEECLFNSLIDNNICFYNQIDNSKVIPLLSNYDLFVFPTRFVGEGTPGVISESLLSGTPVLTSNFPQAKILLRKDYDSIFFKMFDKNNLKEKMLWAAKNKNRLYEMRKNVLESSRIFTYDYNRKTFLKYICGEKND